MRPIVSPKVWTKILSFNSLESLNKYILLTRFRESLPKVVLDTDKEWGTVIYGCLMVKIRFFETFSPKYWFLGAEINKTSKRTDIM